MKKTLKKFMTYQKLNGIKRRAVAACPGGWLWQMAEEANRIARAEGYDLHLTGKDFAYVRRRHRRPALIA